MFTYTSFPTLYKYSQFHAKTNHYCSGISGWRSSKINISTVPPNENRFTLKANCGGGFQQKRAKQKTKTTTERKFLRNFSHDINQKSVEFHFSPTELTLMRTLRINFEIFNVPQLLKNHFAKLTKSVAQYTEAGSQKKKSVCSSLRCFLCLLRTRVRFRCGVRSFVFANRFYLFFAHAFSPRLISKHERKAKWQLIVKMELPVWQANLLRAVFCQSQCMTVTPSGG